MMGLNPEAAVTVIESLAVPPVAAGANCGYDAADTVAVVATMHQHLGNMPLVAKGNCGQPRYHGGKFEYGKSTAYMACYAQLARDAGARIIGGCCGTTAKHLYAMHQALQNYRPTAFSSYRAQRLLQKKSID
jgi:5-methyltetrahydrofolate--homocysteine methyltransferase